MWPFKLVLTQTLKPGVLEGLCGPTEVVPFYKARFFRGL
jgi:hypothetical protein